MYVKMSEEAVNSQLQRVNESIGRVKARMESEGANLQYAQRELADAETWLERYATEKVRLEKALAGAKPKHEIFVTMHVDTTELRAALDRELFLIRFHQMIETNRRLHNLR